MSTLAAITFSALKGLALTVTAVNVSVLAAALACMFFLYRLANKKGKSLKSIAECSIHYVWLFN